MPDLYERVDAYIDGLFAPTDRVLERAVERTRKAGMPEIQVSPGQGKFLYLLAKMIGARRILELGTLAGYSTIWLARALPEDGRLTSLEYEPRHAEVARENLADAGLSAKTEIMVGAALDVLPELAARGEPAFDLIFIDADKDNYPAYLDWAVKLARPGGLILADNVIRDGKVMEPGADQWAKGAAAFNRALAVHPKLEAVILQQVGIKGHDGLAIARVKT